LQINYQIKKAHFSYLIRVGPVLNSATYHAGMWGMEALIYCGNCRKNPPHNVAISRSNFIAFSAKIIRTGHKNYECH